MAQDFAKDMTKIQIAINFIKLTKLDVYLFIQVFAVVMQDITSTQLAKDKICINQLRFPREYCLTLSSNGSQDAATSSVLAQANLIKKWEVLIETVPASIVSLFLGSWIEKYPVYLKTIMLLPCLGAIIQISVCLTNALFFNVSSWAMLVAFLLTGFSGSLTLLYSLFNIYVAWSTPTRFLILRYAIVKFAIRVGGLLGTYFAGHILAMKPWFYGQPENYLGVLLVSLVLLVIGLIWGLSVHLEAVPETADKFENLSHREVVRDVFHFSTFKKIATPLTMKRSGIDQFRIIMLVIAGSSTYMTITGDDAISNQYAQHVYGWSAEKYTSLTLTLVNILLALLSVLTPQPLKTIVTRDSAVGLIGAVSGLLMIAVKGIFTNEIGFAIALCLGALSSISAAANAAVVAQLIDPHETGKTFVLISVINSYIAIISAYFFPAVYNATVDFCPGLIYNIGAILMLIPTGNFLGNDIAAVVRQRRARQKQQQSIDCNINRLNTIVELDEKPSQSSGEKNDVNE